MSATVRFYRVERNYDNSVASKDVVQKFAVIVDEQAGVTEIINMDSIELVGFVIDTLRKGLQLRLAVGGFDSQDNFHKAPNIKLGVWRLDQVADPDGWAQFVEGRRVWDFDQILTFLHNRKGKGKYNISYIAREQWGAGDKIETETDADPIPDPVGPRTPPVPPEDTVPV